MSEEIKITEEKECNCFCKSKAFKNFITVALGTFVGVYCALSLFAALHRPPVMPPPQFGFGCVPCKMMHYQHAGKPEARDFKKFIPLEHQKRTPFEASQKAEND